MIRPLVLASLFLAPCLLAACNAPPAMILPGKLDLPVASGDRIKLCTDDGLDDTTPDLDCVLGGETRAIAPYEAPLKARGWKQGEAGANGVEAWTLGEGTACKRLVIDGAREEVSRRQFTLLRFELGPCPAA